MTRLLQSRTVFGVALVLALVGLVSLRGVYGDDVPCYETIKEIPCPTLPANDTCDAQFKNQPPEKQVWDPYGTPPNRSAETTCNALVYNARQSGQWGQDKTLPCFMPGGQTGYKCIPETKDGIVERVECGKQYKCEWKGSAGGCVQSNVLTSPGTYFADKYTLTPTGCIPVKKSE